MRRSTDKFLLNSNKRLLTHELHFINAKKLGVDMETVGEFHSRREACEALPDMAKLLPEHIVFVSKVAAAGWMETQVKVEA